MKKDLIRADADGYGEKCMDCVREKPFCARRWRIRRKIQKCSDLAAYHNDSIKKESPNEGTETLLRKTDVLTSCNHKKESPNKGTETPDH